MKEKIKDFLRENGFQEESDLEMTSTDNERHVSIEPIDDWYAIYIYKFRSFPLPHVAVICGESEIEQLKKYIKN